MIDFREMLANARNDLREYVMDMLEGHDETNPVKCYIMIDIPGMPYDICPHIESIYRDKNNNIWIKYEDKECYTDFETLTIEQIADVVNELQYVVK